MTQSKTKVYTFDVNINLNIWFTMSNIYMTHMIFGRIFVRFVFDFRCGRDAVGPRIVREIAETQNE